MSFQVKVSIIRAALKFHRKARVPHGRQHRLRTWCPWDSYSFQSSSLSTTTTLGLSTHKRRSSSLSLSVWTKEAATCSVDFPVQKRLLALPPAIAIHLAIGSIYVYSMWTPAMSTALGVMVAAPDDWTYSSLLPVFSCAAGSCGLTTYTLGEWVEKIGPRISGIIGSGFWSGGLLVTALGVDMHSLPLVYLGYGVMGGIGWGLMYLTPVTSVIKWFPDKRGLASGLALSAFGAGAAIAPSLIHTLIDNFAVAPVFVGDYVLNVGGADVSIGSEQIVDQSLVKLTTLSDGSQIVSSLSTIGEPGTPVVVATEADVSKLSKLAESGPGVYIIGTGDTGVSKSLAALGVFYGCLGAIGSRFMIIPHPDWTPHPSLPQSGPQCITANDKLSVTNNTVRPHQETHDFGLPASYVTMNTIQFPLLWLFLFCNATGGMALLSSSKLMLTDIFAGVAPQVVTPVFSTGYVSALGIGMAMGRFGWSALSDYIGRRNVYMLFGLGVPIVGLAPHLCHTTIDVVGNGGGEANVLPYLITFCSGSILAATFYGGIFSVLPAYLCDLFGQKHAGAIHGKALTAWSVSAISGPMGLAYLRSSSQHDALHDLLRVIEAHDEYALDRSFGCSIHDKDAIEKLVEAKTLTVERLIALAPPGTIDPTPFFYDSTCYAAAGLMGFGALCHLGIHPLDLKKTLSEIKNSGDRKAF